MNIFAGTSGYSYKEWKGHFYPDKLPANKMLSFYAERLPAVEINNTFYRLPKPGLLQSWAEQVPAGFRFSIKAARRITHIKRLKDAHEETAYLLDTLKTLKSALGVVLFQLPPFLRADLGLLENFLELLPAGTPAAFEFRHPSWFDHRVKALLKKRNAALCIADTESGNSEIISTADWGYLRLRRSDYTDEDLEAWAARLGGQDWDRAFVFFKHEDEGAGPRLAGRLLEIVSSA